MPEEIEELVYDYDMPALHSELEPGDDLAILKGRIMQLVKIASNQIRVTHTFPPPASTQPPVWPTRDTALPVRSFGATVMFDVAALRPPPSPRPGPSRPHPNHGRQSIRQWCCR